MGKRSGDVRARRRHRKKTAFGRGTYSQREAAIPNNDQEQREDR